METQLTEFNNAFAPWQNSTAFNTYWQYSFVSRAAFYANITGRYREYMIRWVQNALWWYDGWVPYFHSQDQGIFSTKIASALCNGAAKKVVGGRIFFKTKKRQSHLEKDAAGEYVINKSLSNITQWATDVGFSQEIKKAAQFAAAAGTALLKLDYTDKTLRIKALRFDSFYPTVGFNGEIIECTCFIKDFTQLFNSGKTTTYNNYYVVEHRYFGDYQMLDGKVLTHVPLCSYEIRKTQGTITTGIDYDTQGEAINFDDLPRTVKRNIAKAFTGISFKRPTLLPFKDYLGVELVNWSNCVSALPELPFGDSLLYNIMPYLQSYDYYWSAFNTDMYIGRGRVITAKPYMSKEAEEHSFNAGLDSMLLMQIPGNPVGPDNKPTPLQFDLRSQSWSEIRTMIIQNIAINTGMNLATIASFLQDTNAARTAYEISTETSETAAFVEDKREILEVPINKILRQVTLFKGLEDEVVIRWSASGLTNIYARSEMISNALSAGYISRKKAIQLFNQDDDEYQLQEEFDNIEQDTKKNMDFGNDDFYSPGGVNEDSEQAVEQAGNSFGRNGSDNQDDSQTGLFQTDTEKQNGQESQ